MSTSSSDTVRPSLHEIVVRGPGQAGTWLRQPRAWPREFDLSPLKRVARDLVGQPRAALRYRRQEHINTKTVYVASDFEVSPMSTTGLVAQVGHLTKTGSSHAKIGGIERGSSGVQRSGERWCSGLSFRAIYMDFGRLEYQEGANIEKVGRHWNQASIVATVDTTLFQIWFGVFHHGSLAPRPQEMSRVVKPV